MLSIYILVMCWTFPEASCHRGKSTESREIAALSPGGIGLRGKNMEELGAVCVKYGLRSFVAAQIAGWLYSKLVRIMDEKTNVSRTVRLLRPDILG